MPKPTRNKLKDDFLAWFRDILGESKTLDYRYPVKGAGVWMPYGYKLRGKILEIMRRHHEDTGHQEVLFPLMVNEENFMKEAEHVKGFEDEVYWVTRGGGHELEEKLVLRPTSETSIYPMYNLWIRSHSDLPIIYYQIVNTFRFETKTTRPLIRVREITTFKEAHTVHATKEGAENQVQIAMGVYEKIFNDLGIPYIISQRPDWDKFAGAEYTNAFDLVLSNGRVLQIGTVHMLGQKFAKTFDITFEQKDGITAHVWQTCYGISERIVAGLIGAHGDDTGLILPPNVAPIQIIIIPILFKDTKEKILKEAEKTVALLRKKGYRVEIDTSEVSPGQKYYKWEAKGVPLRIEIGPKDIAKQQVVIVRRDTGEKAFIPLKNLDKTVKDLLDKSRVHLKEDAWLRFNKLIHSPQTLKEANKIINAGGGMCIVPWCGEEKCANHIEETISGTILGTPLKWKTSSENTSCVVCGKPEWKKISIGRAY